MNLNQNSDKEHQFIWQQRNFVLKSESSCTPSRKAEIYRQNIAQLTSNLASKDLDEYFTLKCICDETRSYGSIVDGSAGDCGLNNFSEKALSIASKFQNQRKPDQWKYGFNEENILNLDCVKQLIEITNSREKLETDQVQNLFTDKTLIAKYFQNKQKVQNEVTRPEKVSKHNSTHRNGNQNIKSHTSVWDFHDDRALNKRPRVEHVVLENESESEDDGQPQSCFKSAREQLVINQKKKNQRFSPQNTSSKRSLGSRPRNQCFAKFLPPSGRKDQAEEDGAMKFKSNESSLKFDGEVHPKLKGIDPNLIELVLSEVMDHGAPIHWDHIAGLEYAKATIKEVVIWPMMRPDIFTGLRGPPKGILLFGPPGTGKTLIGKCIASQSGATFFSISASSLTSKWIGQGEKMVRALFAVASTNQPAVIFIDEIDSLLSQRSDSEHESSRRIKTEFFVQLDGATTASEDRILVVGATNRPHEIDEAARRRLVKRLYIPLPDNSAREQIIHKLLLEQAFNMTQEEIASVVERTDGFSGADVTNLCKEAALGPIRSLQFQDISKISKDDVRPILAEDFDKALERVRPSVSKNDLVSYEKWNQIFGCGGI